jgi:hypothetical protein
MLVDTLTVACHMAATTVGRRCLAAAGCLPRWLGQARQLPPKLLQLLLMLPLTCVTDWTTKPYFVPLYRGGQWTEGQISTGRGYDAEDSCPLLLKQQVRSQSLYAPGVCMAVNARACVSMCAVDGVYTYCWVCDYLRHRFAAIGSCQHDAPVAVAGLHMSTGGMLVVVRAVLLVGCRLFIQR